MCRLAGWRVSSRFSRAGNPDPAPRQDDRSSLGTRKWLTVIGWFEWPNYSKPFSFRSQPLGLWYADTQNYCSVIKKNKGTGGNALNIPQYDMRMTQWVLGSEDSWRAGEQREAVEGEGLVFWWVSMESCSVGSLIKGVNHQWGPIQVKYL